MTGWQVALIMFILFLLPLGLVISGDIKEMNRDTNRSHERIECRNHHLEHCDDIK